jgi:DNA repair photolyase
MKAIYQPKGKAAEYAAWACNFYVGCSNGCEYCYCKKGILAGAMGMEKPQLKKCFKDGADALRILTHEVYVNRQELSERGLFFSFTTDPLLPETYALTWNAISICQTHGTPVKVLTKRADEALKLISGTPKGKENTIAIGFTLTGHDELEPGASTNAERIEAMRKLHDAGFKTFASIEPIIDFSASFRMIMDSKTYCDQYKIGLMAGSRPFMVDILCFIQEVQKLIPHTPLYFKDSLLKAAGIDRGSLPANCVDRDYNLFT